MDMSKAALPPRSGGYTNTDERHPLFPLYRQYLNSCARNMIDAPDFGDWLYKYERDKLNTRYTQHEQYPAFLTWMRETKAGRRQCLPSRAMPNGLNFPANFVYWIDGGRW